MEPDRERRARWQVGTGLLLAAGGAVLAQTFWPAPTFDQVLVEVVGDVLRPGLHAVDTPTVHAALRAAGADPAGPDDGLAFGDRVWVDASGVRVLPPSDPLLVGRKVDLNRADARALAAIPGVSEAQAGAIVTWRDAHGPFGTLADVEVVPGVGPATRARLAPHVQVP